MTTKTTHIVVLGGGYSGVMAALRLAGRTKRLGVTITMVNSVDHFVERPRLHEEATGIQLRHRPVTQMLRGTNAQLTVGWVTAIDAGRQCIYLHTEAGEQLLAYDYLINALGSRVDRDSIPGVNRPGFPGDLVS